MIRSNRPLNDFLIAFGDLPLNETMTLTVQPWESVRGGSYAAWPISEHRQSLALRERSFDDSNCCVPRLSPNRRPTEFAVLRSE